MAASSCPGPKVGAACQSICALVRLGVGVQDVFDGQLAQARCVQATDAMRR